LLFLFESVSLVDENQVHAEFDAGLRLTVHPKLGHVVAGALMRREEMHLRGDCGGEGQGHRSLARAALTFKEERLAVWLSGYFLEDELWLSEADKVCDLPWPVFFAQR
jgi:hypothetical protein